MAKSATKAKPASEKKPAERIEHEGLLDVRGLTTYFKLGSGHVKAVQDVSFTVAPGESLGLAGESGCGKTTAALSILKLLPENGRVVGGEVLFDGKNLAKRTEYGMSKIRWKEISIIFQGAMNALNPVRETGKQIAEPIQLHEGLGEKQAMARVRELYDLVGINPKRVMDFPHQLSGGMRQRAMIAMALACNPKLIIGDEPTTALDVMVQAQILELIGRLRKELRPLVHPHQPRPLGDGRDLRQGRRHVRRRGGRERHHDRHLPQRHAPVHTPAHQELPQHPREAGDGELHQGRPAQPARPAARLRVLPAVRRARRDLPHRPPRAHRGRARALRALLPRQGPSVASLRRRRPRRREGGVTMATDQTGRPDLKLAPETGDVLFDVRDLEVYFPIHESFFKSMVSTEKKCVKAVDHISFQVMKGEILALVGESGCGKTTTGRTLLRLEEATGGDVLYKGQPVRKYSSKELREYRKKAQIIFQDPYNSINPKQTIFDIVAEPLEVNGVCSSEREKEEKVIDGDQRGRAASGDRVPVPLPARALAAGSGSASASPAPRCSTPT